MRILHDYLISENTVLLTGEFDCYGNLCSMVVDGEDQFLVTMPPVQLIDKALLTIGSDFLGALKSSKFLLGPIRMRPIKLNANLDVWLFPTKSFKKQNCVWFSLSHVKKTTAVGPRKTEVQLSFGHMFELEMKESAFNHKRQKAEQLKEHITKNSQSPLTFYLEPKSGFYISEDQQENTYHFLKKE